MSDTGGAKNTGTQACGKIGGTAYIVKGYLRKDAREDIGLQTAAGYS